jgi:hypothetical protein
MKESKKKVMMQELSKEEATNTYGGKRCIAMVVAAGGKIALVVVER